VVEVVEPVVAIGVGVVAEVVPSMPGGFILSNRGKSCSLCVAVVVAVDGVEHAGLVRLAQQRQELLNF
jgi:hypothetical protein